MDVDDERYRGSGAPAVAWGPRMRSARLLVAALAVSLAGAGSGWLALPRPASAADLVEVAGTVRNADQTPAVGAEVLVGVAGSDIVQPATTDAAGAFAVQVEAQIGDTLDLRATGVTVRSSPDQAGCVHASTPTGSVSVTIETLPLEALDVLMDSVIEDTVCAATATPGRRPPTPPATDAGAGSAAAGPRPTGWSIVLLMAGTLCLALGAGALSARRRSSRSRG